jgi:hypothetical protein
MPQDPRKRRQGLPRGAGQVRQRTEETARDQVELLTETLAKLEQIQVAAWTDPKKIYELAILAQRDIALTIAALTNIQNWMIEMGMGMGRPPDERGNA